MNNGVLDGWRTLDKIEQDIVPLSPKLTMSSIAVSLRRIAIALESTQAHTSQISGHADRNATQLGSIVQELNSVRNAINMHADDIERAAQKMTADLVPIVIDRMDGLIRMLELRASQTIVGVPLGGELEHG